MIKIHNTSLYFTFLCCLLLYFKTRGELAKQEKLYLTEYKQVPSVKIEVADNTRPPYSAFYDGFIGNIKNFSFKVNESGGYECTTEIIAHGEILESLK